jgi:hypothetical protein
MISILLKGSGNSNFNLSNFNISFFIISVILFDILPIGKNYHIVNILCSVII